MNVRKRERSFDRDTDADLTQSGLHSASPSAIPVERRTMTEAILQHVELSNSNARDQHGLKPLRVLELFSGLGGMRLGLVRSLQKASVDSAAMRVVALDTSARLNAMYKLNFGESPVQKLVEHYKERDVDGRFDIWLMSPPCQPYTTTANAKQLDVADLRSRGLGHVVSLLTKVAEPPRRLFLENVRGFLGSHMCLCFLTAIVRRGYTYRIVVLSPMHLAIPNCRLRVYVIAERSDRFAMPPTGERPAEQQAEASDDAVSGGILPLTQLFERGSIVFGTSDPRPITKTDFAAVNRGQTQHSSAPPANVAPTPQRFSRAQTGDADDDDESNDEGGDAPHTSASPIGNISENTWQLTAAPLRSVILAPACDAPSAALFVPVELLRKPAFKIMSIVGMHDRVTRCFTRGYGQVAHVSSGSLFYEHAESALAKTPLDRSDMTVHHGRIRYFSPRELLRLFQFPETYRFPAEMPHRECFKLIGNSVNVAAVAHVLDGFLWSDKPSS